MLPLAQRHNRGHHLITVGFQRITCHLLAHATLKRYLDGVCREHRRRRRGNHRTCAWCHRSDGHRQRNRLRLRLRLGLGLRC